MHDLDALLEPFPWSQNRKAETWTEHFLVILLHTCTMASFCCLTAHFIHNTDGNEVIVFSVL